MHSISGLMEQWQLYKAPREDVCLGGVCLGECLPSEGVCPGGGGSAQGSAQGVSARGVCPGVSAQGGVCLGLSAQGVSAWRCLPRGCLPRGV